jgi:hypothetical protein
MQQHQASSVRLVGRRGAIQITRRPRGEVLVSLEGHRADELLPRAAAELAHDLGRLAHLVVDATDADDETRLACSRWADAHRDRAARVTFLASAIDADTRVAEVGPPSRPAIPGRGPVSTHPAPVVQLRHG